MSLSLNFLVQCDCVLLPCPSLMPYCMPIMIRCLLVSLGAMRCACLLCAPVLMVLRPCSCRPYRSAMCYPYALLVILSGQVTPPMSCHSEDIKPNYRCNLMSAVGNVEAVGLCLFLRNLCQALLQERPPIGRNEELTKREKA